MRTRHRPYFLRLGPALVLAASILPLSAASWRAGAGAGASAGDRPPPDAAVRLGARADSTVTVTLTNTLTFEPKRVTIAVGQTVTWHNTSLLVHTVTGDPAKATREGSAALPKGAEAFDSGNLQPDSTFSHTFERPGTYRYFCIPHEGASMVGEIVVEPKAD